LTALDEALAADAKSWRIYALRGEIRLNQQDLQAALAEFRQSVVYPDAEYRSHFRHGHCARKLGEHQEAIAAYTKALELSPNDIEALKGRSRAYQELRDFENALKDIQPVAEQVKTDPYVFATRAFLFLETDQNEGALADAERAIELDPLSVNAYGFKAYALGRLGRLDEADAALEKAFELDADDAFILKMRTRMTELRAVKK
jgi:tetratricopeptide (TPR) repeat protein